MAYPPPLFLLAPPRSFTSVISGVLGQHPEIFGAPELNLFRNETVEGYLTDRSRKGDQRSPFWRLMRQRDGALRTIALLYTGEQTLNSVDLASRWLRRRSQCTTASVFQELCQKVSPLILLDKSPRYVRRLIYLERILQAFPNARFIHLLRHPRGVCESIIKADIGPLSALFLGAIDDDGNKPTVDPQFAWLDAHVVIMAFLSKLPRTQWMRIKGEDFLRDIEGSAKEVCQWLNIDSSAASLDLMKHPENSPFACFGPATARSGNDPLFLTSPELRPFTAKAQSLDDRLSWRPDEAFFNAEVKALAQNLGYT